MSSSQTPSRSASQGGLLDRLGAAWIHFRDGVRLLRPTWFGAVVVGLVCAVFLVPQGVDVLESLTDPLPEAGAGKWLPLVLLYVSAWIFACAAWYFPRALLYVDYGLGSDRLTERQRDRWRTWWPRTLGILPLVFLALGFARSASWLNAIGSLALAGVFAAFVVLRRRGRRLADPAEKMSETTSAAFALLLAIAGLFFLACVLSQVRIPRWLGSAGILLLTGATWIAIGSMLVYPAYRYRDKRLPSLLLVPVVWGILIGSCTDNHELRRVEGATTLPERPTIREHFDGWLRARERGGGPVPVFVVAAEGGGIRAAYWTAAVLGRLSDDVPGFACHVFAISGVSGGSVGAAVYAALLADSARAGRFDCAGPPATTADVQKQASRILGQDFLAPVVAGMLTSDMAQRLLPVRLFRDRAEYLEHSWEKAWPDPSAPSVEGNPLAEDFLALWRGTGYGVPSLFLNVTWVGNGSRGAVSNLRLDVEGLNQVSDVLHVLGRPIPLSTAAHAGARFPYVSPPGTITQGGRTLGHVVDGGYFENSGALTAAEVGEILEDVCRRGRRCQLAPVILTNSTRDPKAPAFGVPRRILVETWTPVATFFSTRGARGRHAEGRFGSDRLHAGASRFEIPRDGRPDPPLGWTLSRRSQKAMDDAITELRAEGVRALLPARASR